MKASVQKSDSTSTDPDGPVRRLSPEQEFRVRVARNDLNRAHELDRVGASAFEIAQAAGALRSSLHNTLAIIDYLVEADPAARPGADRSAAVLLTPSCRVGGRNPDLHQWCGYPGTLTATGWTWIPCTCECHTPEAVR